MNAQLQWIAAPPASPLHAAAMLATGYKLVDVDAIAQLSPIIAQTAVELRREQIDSRRFWANVVPWGAGLAPPLSRKIATQLLANLECCNLAISRDELLLRLGPLREAWDSRGPGLWHCLSRVVREKIAPPTSSIILVRPALGGGGTAFPQAAAISLEAVLANPLRELPEAVRLAWLLAQLAFVTGEAGRHNLSLVLIAVVLAAAEEVELARCDLSTIRTALKAWHVEKDLPECETLAASIYSWWQSFCASSGSLGSSLAESLLIFA